MRLEDAEDHACPGVVQVAEWIRNFTDMSAGNCTFKFQWRGEICERYRKSFVVLCES